MSEPESAASELGLDGRVAIVTGGGARGFEIGNGRAAAILLARAGAAVVVVDRDADASQRTVEMIEGEGGSAVPFAADVTDESACEALRSMVTGELGPPQVLVNNVGIGAAGTVLQTDPAVWERVMNTNVTSMYLTSRALIPAMAEAGGAIVNIGSISAIRPKGNTAYSTSKGAVIALTQAMAVDHAEAGIRVNAVMPGPVFTPMVNGPNMTPQVREQRKNASALRIEGSPWDIGHAVTFLASNHARYITGQALVVDGGVTLRSPER
ncbi:MAG: SDR family oxidoreductase [Gammaproteobacteria bacterium]|nr:SDR family oxidoreductase [Gammaproteobacteria bacterium]